MFRGIVGSPAAVAPATEQPASRADQPRRRGERRQGRVADSSNCHQSLAAPGSLTGPPRDVCRHHCYHEARRPTTADSRFTEPRRPGYCGIAVLHSQNESWLSITVITSNSGCGLCGGTCNYELPRRGTRVRRYAEELRREHTMRFWCSW